MQNRFEKFARIFSRRHKQTTFSDAGFFGVLRVKSIGLFFWFRRSSKYIFKMVMVAVAAILDILDFQFKQFQLSTKTCLCKYVENFTFKNRKKFR